MLQRIQSDRINNLPPSEQRGKQPVHVILDNDTRWLSQLYMIRRALRLRHYITLLLNEFQVEWEAENRSKRTNRITPSASRNMPSILRPENQLSPEDWEVLNHFETILSYYEATVIQLEGDGQIRQRKNGFTGSYGNIWEVLQGFEFLLEKLEYYKQVAADYPDPEHFRIGCNLAWSKLNTYYDKCDETPVYYAAIALHPSYRWAWFETTWIDHPDWVNKAKEMVQQVWNTQYRDLAMPGVENHTNKWPRVFKNPFQEHVDKGRTRGSPSPSQQLLSNEYLNWQAITDPGDDEIEDPIQYWHERRYRYPRLSRMALDFLTVPSMSAECERLFSAAKRMVRDERKCLDSEAIATCQVLRSWYRAGFVDQLDPIITSWEEQQQADTWASLPEEEVVKQATSWIKALPPQSRD